MVESNRHLVQGALLVLALGCGESDAPAPSSRDSGASGGGAGELSSGGSGGSLGPKPSSGGASPTGGVSGNGSGAGAMPAGGAAAQAGAVSESGRPSSGGATDGGAGGAADDGLEPVTVIRGDAGATYIDLTVRGVALDDHEGQLVTVRIGRPDRPPERLGGGRALIRGGTFELFFPAVWEDSLYKQKLVHIDVDGDGTCSAAGDRVFSDTRAASAPELIVRGSGERGRYDIPQAGSPSEVEAHCDLMNAVWPSQ